jgi:hypothetical protein
MNTFLAVNKKRIDSIRYSINEFKLRNPANSGDMPINDILFLYNGFVSEINKLQEEVDKINRELNLYKNVSK